MNANAEVLHPATTEVAEYTETARGLAELRQQLEGATFDCTTAAGDKQARESRRALVSLRTTLEAKRQELKAPLLERSRLIDAEAKRITGEIVKLEQPIDAVIKAEEARREAIRAERERQEQERRAANIAKVDAIRGIPLSLVGKPVSAIEAATDKLANGCIDVDEDFHDAAREAHAATLAKLNEMHAAAVAAEAEAERLSAERAELERQQAAERERVAAERAEIERHQAEREAAMRAEQERLDAERAEADRLRREQQAREDAERAERQRQEDEARELERRRLADEAERVAQARREQAERDAAERAEAQARAEAAAIKAATLHEAGTEALALLRELGAGDHLTARKLAAALERA